MRRLRRIRKRVAPAGEFELRAERKSEIFFLKIVNFCTKRKYKALNNFQERLKVAEYMEKKTESIC